MDLLCPRCGEPWDMDELHEVPGKTWTQAQRAFRRVGCEVFGERHGTAYESDSDELTPAQKAALIYEMLGDDIDGAAAMIEDFS